MIYYFIGIKGSGMSALALVMDGLGYKVMGSDKPNHYFTEDGLVERGIEILDFDPENLTDDMIIVQGNAFGDENVEVKRAKEMGLKIYTYQEMIDFITHDLKLIAISGCHGKTTTTTMMSKLFEDSGISYLIGDGTGFGKKDTPYFALEACEFKRHFLSYNPYYSVITNVELDHTDYYRDIEDVLDAFTSFANNARHYVILNGDDKYASMIKTDKPVLTFGFGEQNDVVCKSEKVEGETTTCDIWFKGEYYDTYTFPFVGDHMISDVMAALSVCYLEGLDKEVIQRKVSEITHAKRRFIEEKFGTNILVDDYAHHPTEIRVTIEAAKKKYPDKQVIAIFKAHTKSRVKRFAKEFAEALDIADKCFVMEIGEDRIELGYEDVTHFNILNYTRSGEEISVETAEKLLPYENSVILFMSSKDIYVLTERYKKLKENM